MKSVLLSVVLLVSGFAFGQGIGIPITGIVVGQGGSQISFPSVRICTVSATGTPCSPTVSLFADQGLSVPVSNPLPNCASIGQQGCADSVGNWMAWTSVSAVFQVQISAGNVNYTYFVLGAGAGAAGVGNELQYRISATQLGAVTGSSWNGTFLNFSSGTAVSWNNDVSFSRHAGGLLDLNTTAIGNQLGSLNLFTLFAHGGISVTGSPVSVGAVGWNGDTDIARCGAALLCIGNGNPADFSGGVQLTSVNGGGPIIRVAKNDSPAQTANIPATNLLTAAAAGTYRLSCYVVITTAATTSSTMPSCSALWTDSDSSAAETVQITTTSAANTVGTNSLSVANTGGAGVAVFQVKSVSNVQFQTSSYASTGGTAMQYAVHVKLEYLGQ